MSDWARSAAVEVHSSGADKFEDWYKAKAPLENVFLYGRHMCAPFFEKELARLPSEARILDVGCGTGEQLSELRRRNLDAVGVEPAPGMLAYAQQRCPDSVFEGSVLQLPFEDNTFDFVYALEVLRYLNEEDNHQGLLEIRRVLKPGGGFFGTFVNRWALDFYLVLVQFQKLSNSLRNFVKFDTPGGLEKSFERAGFVGGETHGAMFAFLRIFQKFGGSAWKYPGKILMPFDSVFSDTCLLKPLSGHLIGIARKPSF
jgi:ubiquinone/menaquinone biosynthesis C-methylase UbiE